MFGFLAPLALFGLSLLAIPVVLHIFKPRKVRELPFSSLRWLRASQHRMSKKIRWHQVLLLMLRAGFITVLVLALASPVLSSREARQWTDRFVILDVGRGMGYDDGLDPTPLERGKAIAGGLIEQVSPGDRTALLRVGTHVRAFGPLTGDASVHRNDLEAVNIEPGGARLTDVLSLIEPMRQTGEHQGEAIELHFITDNAAHKWSQGAIDHFMGRLSRAGAVDARHAEDEAGKDVDDEATDDADGEPAVPVSVNVIDVSPEMFEHAWIADARLIERRGGRQRTLRVQVGATGAEPQTRTLHLTGIEGLGDEQQQITVTPGTFERVTFELPSAEELELDGAVAELRLEPGGPLPGDDVHWVNLDATAVTRVLVVEPEVTQVTEMQPGHHLRTALRTLDEEALGRIEVVRHAPDDVLAEAIERADAIVLAEVPELAEGDLRALEQRVRQGAGLAVFLGPTIDRTFYNNQLHDPLQPNDSLLPVQLGEPVEEPDHSPLARLDTDHALFRGLSDPLYGDLEGTRFTNYFELEPAEDARGVRTLAHIGEREPAIIERPFGSGRVMLFNATANDAWSDLPRRRSYLPVVRRMVGELAGGLQQGTFTVGEAASMPLPVDVDGADDAAVRIEVRTPGNERFTPTLDEMRGRRVMRFDTLDEPGIYRVTVRAGDEVHSFPFVVQPDQAANLPRRMNEQALGSWWEPADVSVLQPASPEEALAATDAARWLMTPWLLALAALLLAAEMFFVHYLCPRANPALSESVINRRGFFRRTTQGAAARSRGGAPRDAETPGQTGLERPDAVAPSPTA